MKSKTTDQRRVNVSVPELWPFLPTKLSDHIDSETLALLLSGSCARLGRSITVLDYDWSRKKFTRIDPLIPQQEYSDFCQSFRHDNLVAGGDQACKQCDINMARKAVRKWQNAPQTKIKQYLCHMKITDFSAVIHIQNKPVAVLLAGQLKPTQGTRLAEKELRKITQGKRKNLTIKHAHAESALKNKLLILPEIPPNFTEQIERERQLIQELAENHHQAHKKEQEQKFLDTLRASRQFGDVQNLQQITSEVEALLGIVREFCHATYLVFYININPQDTVLTPIAANGLDHQGELPHFNWRKAGLGEQNQTNRAKLIMPESLELKNGIRGANKTLLGNAAGGVASMLGHSYRIVMIFGPLQTNPDLASEKSFLFQVNRIIGWSAHPKLQALRLRIEQEKRDTYTTLLQHRFRTALTPIATHTGTSQIHLEKHPQKNTVLAPVMRSIHAAHDLALQLGKTTKETLRSTDVMVEHKDLIFEWFPISVLVANCAEGFVAEAKRKSRELIIDSSIENTPYADVDIARLTIAISNLLENAVKYSYPATTISVRALPAGINFIDIEIENYGNAIPQDKLTDIFKKGKRSLVNAKMGRIPGTGYGLWESKAVMEAHGGTIHAQSEPTGRHHRIGEIHQVIFRFRIPLRQDA